MRRKKRGPGLIILLTMISIGIAAAYFYLHTSTEDEAAEAIDTFYSYEQDGAFSSSWAMFHPQMQEKFTKVDYLQDRPEMLFSDFGVETFTYSLGKTKKIHDWKMEPGAEPIDVVYQVTVTQTFQGKYGNIDMEQDVYTAEMDGEWVVLWDYGGR